MFGIELITSEFHIISFLFGLTTGALASKTIQILIGKVLHKYAGIEEDDNV